MVVTEETTMADFEPWSGAASTYETLTTSQLDQLTFMFEELYPEGCSDTTINDILWFERDTIAQWLGFCDWEELEEENANEFD